ncbi:hypothetical protein [Mycolicibacterium sp.]|uniref:hypothetical protein n=1 Tax=Mycolicibacterium sp. TaxID=2320850 RepID=UPI0037C80873
MDVFLVVDDPNHEFYRKPWKAADVLNSHLGSVTAVRSVTVLDNNRGITSTYRDSEAGL